MLTGKKLGEAIGAAIKAKGVSQKAVAGVFGVQPPSVSDWIKRGTISKDKLIKLFDYFSDVVGPTHWGLNYNTNLRDLETQAVVNEPTKTAQLAPRLPDETKEVMRIMADTDATGRAMALAAVKVALAGYKPAKANRVS